MDEIVDSFSTGLQDEMAYVFKIYAKDRMYWDPVNEKYVNYDEKKKLLENLEKWKINIK